MSDPSVCSYHCVCKLINETFSGEHLVQSSVVAPLCCNKLAMVRVNKQSGLTILFSQMWSRGPNLAAKIDQKWNIDGIHSY